MSARRRQPSPPGPRTPPRSGRRRWRLIPSWRVVRWILLPLLLLAVLAVAGVAVAAYLYWPTDLPPAKALEEYTPSVGSRVYAHDDEFLTEFQPEKRIFVPLQQIPPALRNAVIAVEDARFYSHFGVDVRGIARAAYANFRHGRVVEGGSTITQQLAKVLFLTPDRSFSRKVKEALLALELEKRYSKDRLLELYLNQVYMGHGAFGVEAAARMYFGKSVQELTLPEAAMLAALPRSPGNYSPFERPELAQRRRAIAVGRLLEQGYISETQAKAANRAPLGLVPSERRRGSGQYFLEYLQQSLEAKYGSDVLYKSGLAIYTTLDPVLQRAAEQALRDGIQALTERQGARAAARGKGAPAPAAPEGAVVVIEAATGYVKALIGGVDFTRTEFNRALHAHRQPGSAFKPFVYLAALETGHAPTEVLDDSPIRYVSAGKVWAPENYDGKFRGPVTLQQALEESINVPTIRLLEEIGVNPVIDAARRAGIQSPLPHDLTLALGSGDVTLLELTAAYGTFANQGVRMEPLMVRYVTDAQGRLVEENIPQGREAIDPAIAGGLTEMLRGVVERGTAIGARVIERPLAGKTGTTNDFSNAWFVGYTPSIVAGVWLGHDRPRSLGPEETGARAALPIWVAVMRAALRGQPVEEFAVAPAPVNGAPAARP
ncbi:MAG TPA: penicillin-binding protein 1A [Methylomirabilota bacterium]